MHGVLRGQNVCGVQFSSHVPRNKKENGTSTLIVIEMSYREKGEQPVPYKHRDVVATSSGSLGKVSKLSI